MSKERRVEASSSAGTKSPSSSSSGNLQGMASAAVDVTALTLAQVETEVSDKWKRPFRTICGQLGKDLPRLATKVTVIGSDGATVLAASYGSDRLAAMKAVLLALQELLEGKDSAMYKTISSEFDAYFKGATDLQIFTSSFIDEKLGEKHPLSYILRSCTQGHFAPPSTVIQANLGITNILNNVAHLIKIRFLGKKVAITHRKDESSHWGSTTYELLTSLSLDRPQELTTVSFRIVELDFNGGCKAELAKEINEKLLRFYHVDMSPTYGGQLSLVGQSLKQFPPFLILNQRSYLRIVHLDDNAIDSIPATISNLSSCLEVLTLTNNALSSVPPELFLLTNLWKLSLSGNKLSSLPDDISKLSNLRELFLSRNTLTSLPSTFTSLSSLEKLSLSRNAFTAKDLLPLAKLTKLQSLAVNVNPLGVKESDSPLDSQAEIASFIAALAKANNLTTL